MINTVSHGQSQDIGWPHSWDKPNLCTQTNFLAEVHILVLYK